MMNIPFLDILLSLVFIYALLSILVSIINEMLSHYNEERGELLRTSILKLLSDDLNLQYGELFYSHPEIQRITAFKKRLSFLGLLPNPSGNKKKLTPSYISSERFALVLVDLIASQTPITQKVVVELNEAGQPVLDSHGRKTYRLAEPLPSMTLIERFAVGLAAMNPSPLRDTLYGFYERSEGSIANLEGQLQKWFNDYMERVSGWYKSRQQKKSIFIGLAVAVLLNVDALHLIKTMSMDGVLRTKLVNQAMVTADNYVKLSDSARQDLGKMIATFSIEDKTFKHLRDSVGGKNVLALRTDPTKLISALRLTHQPLLDSMASCLAVQDSLADHAFEVADRVTGIAGALNLPIGYSQSSAPWSWLPANKSKVLKADLNTADAGLMAYNERRNKGEEPWTYTKYVLGILISGFTLSVGAPFWFNLLLKLVDIRRAGVKPTSNK